MAVQASAESARGMSFGRRLPVILGSEEAECGLVCLAMVCGFHGKPETLTSLRQRYSVSRSGLTLRSIVKVADSLGLSNRSIKVDLKDLSKLTLPAILHWGFRHFVVLSRVERTRVLIHDPSSGARWAKMSEVSDLFTGVALELFPSASFSRSPPPKALKLKTIIPSMPGLSGSVVQVLALSIAFQICVVAMPLQLQIVVDQVIGRLNLPILPVVALAFAGLVLVQAVLVGIRDWFLQILGNQFTIQLMANIVRHLLRLPVGYFERRRTGDILSRLDSITKIQEFLTRGMLAALVDGGMAILAAMMLFAYSAQMAIVVILVTILNAAINFAFYGPISAKTLEQLQAAGAEQSLMVETVGAISLIRLMGGEPDREARWRGLYTEVVAASQDAAALQLWATGFQTVLNGLLLVAILYMGAHRVLDGVGFSIGMLTAFLAFQRTFSDRSASLIFQTSQFRMLGVHLQRIEDVVGTPPEWEDGVETGYNFAGEISLRNVGFRYGLSDPMIFTDLTLDVRAGEFLAIVGPTGRGKTTLLNLLMGLYRPETGAVLLDGRPATPSLWREWRQHLGFVAQDDHPLSGTVADNISFFDPTLDMDRVVEVAKSAQIHSEIMAMPMQYRSSIAELGTNLSGGQKQRLMLARALYRRPKILVLDEGTANLDLGTEAKIADVIAELPITRIVVAHRPSLIRRADRVVALEGGQVRAVDPAEAAGVH
jgi:ATP-binding cassette subfamily B protein RaxB